MRAASWLDSGVLWFTLSLLCDTDSDKALACTSSLWRWRPELRLDYGMLLSLLLSLHVWHWLWTKDNSGALTLSLSHVCVWHWLWQSACTSSLWRWRLDSGVLVSLLPPLYVFDIDSELRITQVRLSPPFPMCVCDTDSDKVLALLPCDDGGRIVFGLRHACVFATFSTCLTLTLNWTHVRLCFASHVCVTLTLTSACTSSLRRWLPYRSWTPACLSLCSFLYMFDIDSGGAHAFPFPCVCDIDSDKVHALLPCDDKGRIAVGLRRVCVFASSSMCLPLTLNSG